jgi:3-hydroxyisobutyrate dehydrogenase-like beta-hydroxyacid dehydrogenase
VNANQGICLIGYGEVGQVLARDLTQRGFRELSAWDVLFADPLSSPAVALGAGRVRAADNLQSALAGAGIVISAVTAAQCSSVARAASQSLQHRAIYVDLNSVSPGVRAAAAAAVSEAGGCYVEAAVMSSIAPKGIATPILLGGPSAAECQPLLQELGFSGAKLYSDVIGAASAVKMCRSVLVKGLEALFTEALLTARHYRVEQTVLESLGDMFPGTDSRELGRYLISRSLVHGRRRAEEMREVARTVCDAGVSPQMSLATAARQDASAEYAHAATLTPLESLLDRVLAETA